MSYNNYHKPSVASGMSRGRVFSARGSFRGRGGGGGDSSGSWSSSSRGRGFSGPSRGRFNWYKEHSTGFDSRTRYTSGVTQGTERYSSRGRGVDESGGYRRYSRADVPEYSSRDHSHHRSPDSQRKRMRTEHGYVQASSTRRSHDGSYGGGTDYNSRYSYSEDKGGYGEERGHGYREERRPVGTFRDRSREDYPHRKPEQMDSSMPPPSGLPPRHLSYPRGSFRGRISRGMRSFSRIMLSRRADTFLARKRPMMDSYTVRKRILTSRATPAETLRRLKIQRLRRLREAAAAAAKEEGKEKDGTKATEDISDDDEKDDAWDEDVEKGDDDEELEEGETPDKKKVKKGKKSPKVSKDEEPEEGEDIDDDDDEEDDDEAKKSVKNGVHVTIKQDSDSRAVSEEFRNQRTNFRGRRFIRLACPHCFTRCTTFKEYENHLYLSRHITAMRKQSFRHKQTLARMRMTQRHKQRIVEAQEESQGTLSLRTKFCLICKLNYRQLRSNHLISEYHRKMRKFLMPYCRVCDVGFKSPMLFENHISSLEHIKRKAYMEEDMKHMHERAREEEGSGIEDDDKDLNLDNFMILDSVGTVDDAGEDADSDAEGKGKDKDTVEGEDKKKLGAEIKLGSEYVKKVEVYYCELCRLYLPRLEIAEKALALHCRTRTHLQRYVRYRDDRALRRKAERIHRKEIAKENAEKDPDAKKNDDDKMDEDGTEKDGTKGSDDAAGKVTIKREEGSEVSQSESRTADLSSETAGEARADGDNQDGDGDLDQDLEAGMDDKLWADVDKDLGELLREVEPGNKSSDEDDDSRAEGGRYDRFRYSEKGSVATTDPPSEGDAGDAVKTNAEPTEADTADSSKDIKKTVDSKAEGDVATKKSSGNTAAAATPTTTASI